MKKTTKYIRYVLIGISLTILILPSYYSYYTPAESTPLDWYPIYFWEDEYFVLLAYVLTPVFILMRYLKVGRVLTFLIKLLGFVSTGFQFLLSAVVVAFPLMDLSPSIGTYLTVFILPLYLLDLWLEDKTQKVV